MKKSILITECSSGIGLDAVLTLATRGYKVFSTARLERDVEMLQSKGLSAYQLDLTDSASICKAVLAVLKTTDGFLDYLFNNGAMGNLEH